MHLRKLMLGGGADTGGEGAKAGGKSSLPPPVPSQAPRDNCGFGGPANTLRALEGGGELWPLQSEGTAALVTKECQRLVAQGARPEAPKRK